jgi:hypothetical protein
MAKKMAYIFYSLDRIIKIVWDIIDCKKSIIEYIDDGNIMKSTEETLR